MPSAHIGGSLGLDGARLHNDTGPALIADNLRIDQVLLRSGWFQATGHAGIRLRDAQIGGTLWLGTWQMTRTGSTDALVEIDGPTYGLQGPLALLTG